ncbi:FAD synthetase 2, chloroplastic-like [Apium graveolens]|uniref:FAD synthetase 2, chloroplastic-like n=1 Tax=Apium graveolens TaxID=4045 RepID=UPI003D7B9286
MLSGSRISHHLRDYNHLHLGFEFGFGLKFNSTSKTSKLHLKSQLGHVSNKKLTHFSSSSFDFGGPLVACIQPNSPFAQSPSLSHSLSQQEDDGESPSERLSAVAGGIVALGKFEALHIGHRELAVQASRVGVPFLLSFVGMAEVLGWEPRAPIVAKCDRKRILSSWAPYCGNVIPSEFEVDFSKVRSLTPRQFVEKLSKKLGVCGVVAGKNYRFGYRASGDASELGNLCKEYGMEAYIINSVMDKKQDTRVISLDDSKEQGQVSSTRVRHALGRGDMNYVSELLGRQHRLMLMANDKERFTRENNRISASNSCLLNLSPVEGLYENCSVVIGDDNFVPCRVTIDTTHIHLELDDTETCIFIASQGISLLGIDFGG